MVEDTAAGKNEDGRPENTGRTTDEEPGRTTMAELLQLLHEKEEYVVQLQEAAAHHEAATARHHHEQDAHRRDLQTQLDRAHQEITALSYDNERFQTVIVQTVVETLAQLGIAPRRRRRSHESGGRTRTSSTRMEEPQERQQHRSSNHNSSSRVLPASKPSIPRPTVPPTQERAAAAAAAVGGPGADEEQQSLRSHEQQPPRFETETTMRQPKCSTTATGATATAAVVVEGQKDWKPRSEPLTQPQPPTTEHETMRKPTKRQEEDPIVGTAGGGIPPVSDSIIKDNRDEATSPSKNDNINFLLPLPFPNDWTLNMLAFDVLEDDTDDEDSWVVVHKHDDACALTYTGPSSSHQFVACVPTITPSDTGFYWKVTLTTLPRPTLRGGSPCDLFIGIIQAAVCGLDDVPSTKSWESSGSNGWKNGYSLSYERGCRQNRHPTLQYFEQGDTLLFGVTVDTFCMYSLFRQEQYCIYLPTPPTSTAPSSSSSSSSSLLPSTSSIPEHYIHFNFSTKGTKVVLAPMNEEERKLLNP